MFVPVSCFILFDYIHIWFGLDWRTFPMRYEEYPAIIFVTSGLLIFVTASILFVQKLNADYVVQILKQAEEIEAEKQKSEKLLHNILPEEVAQELKETGQATPKEYDLVTVLFTDFKGFTNIAEQITPQEVIENLNTCFLAFDEICDKYGLEKIKTIGDSYMCAGGLPLPNTTNPIDVVLAGLAMQAWMHQWAEDKKAKGQKAWELRLGIHSGEAIAGVVGKNKFAYDIWGDTVNLASRMESSGEVGKVNISEATYNLVKDSFICVQRGAVMAKNKGEMQMYFVERIL
jgi:adenylate cyclase